MADITKFSGTFNPPVDVNVLPTDDIVNQFDNPNTGAFWLSYPPPVQALRLITNPALRYSTAQALAAEGYANIDPVLHGLVSLGPYLMIRERQIEMVYGGVQFSKPPFGVIIMDNTLANFPAWQPSTPSPTPAPSDLVGALQFGNVYGIQGTLVDPINPDTGKPFNPGELYRKDSRGVFMFGQLPTGFPGTGQVTDVFFLVGSNVS